MWQLHWLNEKCSSQTHAWHWALLALFGRLWTFRWPSPTGRSTSGFESLQSGSTSCSLPPSCVQMKCDSLCILTARLDLHFCSLPASHDRRCPLWNCNQKQTLSFLTCFLSGYFITATERQLIPQYYWQWTVFHHNTDLETWTYNYIDTANTELVPDIIKKTSTRRLLKGFTSSSCMETLRTRWPSSRWRPEVREPHHL